MPLRSAIAIGAAGKFAPVGLLIVAAMLFLFRKIYSEVVGALPLNGGAYNALLNTTSKSASVGRRMPDDSVVHGDGSDFCRRGDALRGEPAAASQRDILWFSWNMVGNDRLAWAVHCSDDHGHLGISLRGDRHFVTHLVTLTLLIIVGIGYLMFSDTGTSTFWNNMTSPLTVHEDISGSPEANGFTAAVTVLDEQGNVVAEMADAHGGHDDDGHDADHNETDAAGHAGEQPTTGTDPAAALATAAAATTTEEASPPEAADSHGGILHKVLKKKSISIATALFFGFSVALLGISGFESSANFVEEQKTEYFRKRFAICGFAF